jgi:hypothetical protein
MQMTKTASVAVISLFVLGLCTAPLAIGAPTKQSKMAACNAQANDKGFSEEKDDERKAFVKECLSAKLVKTGGAQQSKMKLCNKEAGIKGLKGDKRKTFMSTCLSN